MNLKLLMEYRNLYISHTCVGTDLNNSRLINTGQKPSQMVGLPLWIMKRWVTFPLIPDVLFSMPTWLPSGAASEKAMFPRQDLWTVSLPVDSLDFRSWKETTKPSTFLISQTKLVSCFIWFMTCHWFDDCTSVGY